MKTKVKSVSDDILEFENGLSLYSSHQSNCCESHFLTFKDLSIADFEGLEFDLDTDAFFEKVEDYGIRLLPVNGHPVSVPGYGYNNGYYSTNLTLCLTGEGVDKEWDVTSCQEISD